jgi:hypothetical protein
VKEKADLASSVHQTLVGEERFLRTITIPTTPSKRPGEMDANPVAVKAAGARLTIDR